MRQQHGFLWSESHDGGGGGGANPSAASDWRTGGGERRPLSARSPGRPWPINRLAKHLTGPAPRTSSLTTPPVFPGPRRSIMVCHGGEMSCLQPADRWPTWSGEPAQTGPRPLSVGGKSGRERWGTLGRRSRGGGGGSLPPPCCQKSRRDASQVWSTVRGGACSHE